MSLHRRIWTLLLALTIPAAAHAAHPKALIGAKRLLQEGVDHGDPARLLKARGAFLGLLAAEPDSPALRYWVAVAAWRAVPMLTAKDREGARRYCEDGLRHVDAALRTDPGFAEALAIKAGLQALALGFDEAATMTLGPQMQVNIARATEMAPENPRVRLVDGINTFHTPEFFGGGAIRALEKLRGALERFDTETHADSTAPDWGRDDALAWAGRCAMKLDDPAAARAYYLQALEANPSNGWVRAGLLPAAEKALAAKTAAGAPDASVSQTPGPPPAAPADTARATGGSRP